MKPTTLLPELVWTGVQFERDVAVSIQDGVIAHTGRISGTESHDEAERLPATAVLPGFANAHSHSFQRAIRGRTERFPAGRGSFWSWREEMYAHARSISADQLYEWNVTAFDEMRAAGMTAVGEFHYLHHEHDGDWAMDDAVIEAAKTAGIRIVLLQAAYQQGGSGVPLSDDQSRFATPDLGSFRSQLEKLRARHEDEMVRFGIVAHSVRAVGPESIRALWALASELELPFHIHVEEQRREIEEFEDEHGKRPMRHLLESLDVSERLTAVHCTHTTSQDLDELVTRGGNICVTPLTEGNLGDGIQPALPRHRDQICLGSDSNARISMIEEMRWLEYVQRLNSETRGSFADSTGALGPALLRTASVNGFRALGLDGGFIEQGRPADLVLIDLSHPSLTGWTDETLLDTLIVGAGNEVVSATIVAGRLRSHR